MPSLELLKCSVRAGPLATKCFGHGPITKVHRDYVYRQVNVFMQAALTDVKQDGVFEG